MNRIAKLVLILPLASAWGFSAFFNKDTAQAYSSFIVTETDSGRELKAAIGDRIIVRLGAQLGTGFSWHPENDPAPQLAFRNSATTEGTGLPGVPQWQEFTYEVREAGSRELVFVYRRPWEKKLPPTRTFSTRVTVGSG
jgi:predicted secreted protein